MILSWMLTVEQSISLCLEFKTSTGKQSAEQKEYQRQVEMAGSKYAIVRSVEQAIRELQLYLG